MSLVYEKGLALLAETVNRQPNRVLRTQPNDEASWRKMSHTIAEAMLGRSAVKVRTDLAVLSTVRAGSQQSERGSRGQKQATPNERLASRLSYGETSKKNRHSSLFWRGVV